MALVDIEGNDPWLSEYETCENLFREIMEQLTLRDREPKTSQTYASLSATIRLRLKQFSGQVRQLRTKVDESSRQRMITAEEAERRTRQVELLQSRDIQIQNLYESRTNDLSIARSKLMAKSTSAFADAGTTSWGIDEDDDDDDRPIDVHVTIHEMRKHQEQILEDQDQGLEELAKVLSRQKQIAQTISNEVDHHNEIIDDLAVHIDRTDGRLTDGTRQVMSISRKDRTCGYWVVIVILFVTILAVGLM